MRSTRCRISWAALLVNVTARIDSGDTSSAVTSQAILWVRTRVLPLPAPARTSIGQGSLDTA